IVNKSTANLYRDSEGRTRRDEKLGAVGPWSSSAEPMQTIFINDPVLNTHMVLDTRSKIARKMPSPQIRMAPGVPFGAIGIAGGWNPYNDYDSGRRHGERAAYSDRFRAVVFAGAADGRDDQA